MYKDVTKREQIVQHTRTKYKSSFSVGDVLDCVWSCFEKSMTFEVINFVNTINSFCGRTPGHNIAVNSVNCHSIDAAFSLLVGENHD